MSLENEQEEVMFLNESQLDEIVKEFVQKPLTDEDRRVKMIILSLVSDLRNSRGEIGSLRISKEHEIELHAQSCLEYQSVIESLRAELAEYRNAAEMANEELRAAERERDEARQANAALLEKLRDIRDNPSYGIAYKRWNRVEEMLAQYDTAQPTAPTVWTCGKCKNNFVGDDCPYCTAQGEEEANVTE